MRQPIIYIYIIYNSVYLNTFDVRGFIIWIYSAGNHKMRKGCTDIFPCEGQPSWQQLEHAVRECMEKNMFTVQFRKVFHGKNRKFEIDVVAKRSGLVLAVDCKRYGRSRHRTSALRGQCATHAIRCEVLSRKEGTTVYPVIVTMLDDGLFFINGCLVVHLTTLNDFLVHLDEYLEQIPCPQTAN